MTARDFVKNYILHDSLIDSVEVIDDGMTIILLIDFAFWMQPGYRETDPETGALKVTFRDVSKCDVSKCNLPENINWDEISILDTTVSGETVTFKLLNDMTDAYSELTICSNNILAEAIKDNE